MNMAAALELAGSLGFGFTYIGLVQYQDDSLNTRLTVDSRSCSPIRISERVMLAAQSFWALRMERQTCPPSKMLG